MLDDIINYYNERPEKKGYEVIGKKLTTLFIAVLLSMGLELMRYYIKLKKDDFTLARAKSSFGI